MRRSLIRALGRVPNIPIRQLPIKPITPLPIPNSPLPITNYQLPITNYQFPIPYSFIKPTIALTNSSGSTGLDMCN